MEKSEKRKEKDVKLRWFSLRSRSSSARRSLSLAFNWWVSSVSTVTWCLNSAIILSLSSAGSFGISSIISGNLAKIVATKAKFKRAFPLRKKQHHIRTKKWKNFQTQHKGQNEALCFFIILLLLLLLVLWQYRWIQQICDIQLYQPVEASTLHVCWGLSHWEDSYHIVLLTRNTTRASSIHCPIYIYTKIQ